MTVQAATETSSNLYGIVDCATNEELGSIVTILASSPFSYLRHARAYLRHKPDHARYRDQIADEIHRLGFWLTEGLTTVAGSMDREKHSYADLLTAVCRQIGIAAAGLAMDEREALLINLFTRQHLLTAEPRMRAALVSEAASAAGKAASGMMSTDAWVPFVSALVEIGYLRRLMVADGRLTGAGAAGRTAVAERRAEPYTTLNIVGEDGQHAFSLAITPQDHSQGWAFMVPDGRTMSKLTPFIQALQPFFSAEQMLAGKHIYSSEVPLAWSDKVGAFVGVAKGHQGMRGLTQVTAAGISGPAVLLTAATAIAQQQQVQRIEQGLDEIKTMLADVSRFQQDERHSKLTGSIRYFRQVAGAVLSGEFAPEVLFAIEQHEAELVKIYDHLVRDLRGATEAMRAVRKEKFKSANYIKALQDAQSVVVSRYDEIILCLRARACGYQLLAAHPGREAGKRARFEAISGDFRPFLPAGEATVAIDQLLREKLQAVSAYDDKATLLTGEDRLFGNIVKGDHAILAAITLPRSLEPRDGDTVAVDLEVEAGKVIGVRVA